MVRNCTKRHLSHLTTSRESTGASVVAMQVVGDARAGINMGNLRCPNACVICGINT